MARNYPTAAQRAERARAAVRSFAAVAILVDTPPMSRTAVMAMMFDHAYVAMTVYAVATERGPLVLNPGMPPAPDDADMFHAAWSDIQGDVYIVVKDFMCDVRHLLDQHGLSFADVQARRLPPEEHPGHNEAAMVSGLLVTLRIYTAICHLNFDALAELGAACHADELAELAEDQAAPIGTAGQILADLHTIEDASPEELAAAARRLHQS